MLVVLQDNTSSLYHKVHVYQLRDQRTVHGCMPHVICRVLLRADAADKAVAEEDVGGVLRRPGADGDLILVSGGCAVALQMDGVPAHGETLQPRLTHVQHSDAATLLAGLG